MKSTIEEINTVIETKAKSMATRKLTETEIGGQLKKAFEMGRKFEKEADEWIEEVWRTRHS